MDRERCKVCDEPAPCGNSSCAVYGKFDAEDLFETPGVAHAADLLARLRPSPTPPAGGLKFDDGKLPLELPPYDAIREIAKVLQFGAKKYGANNWRKGLSYSRLFGALMRHLWAWWLGEDKDPETGFSHLAHAGCCLLFLLHFVLRNAPDNRKEYNA